MAAAATAALAAAVLASLASPTTARSAYSVLRPNGTNASNGTNGTDVGLVARLDGARRLMDPAQGGSPSEAPRLATCEHTVFMCKQPSAEQECPHVRPACVRPLFVTGTGFSGTKVSGPSDGKMFFRI